MAQRSAIKARSARAASPSRAALAPWGLREGSPEYRDQQPRAIAAETAESGAALCLKHSALDLELSIKFVIFCLLDEICVS